MDTNQQVSISLGEYLELKEAYDKRNWLKIDNSTTITSDGTPVATRSGDTWHIISEDAEYARDLVSHINSRGRDFNILREATIKFLAEFKCMTSREFAEWQKTLKKRYDNDGAKYLNEMIPIVTKEMEDKKVEAKKTKKKEVAATPEATPEADC